jgi:hypothetical protein
MIHRDSRFPSISRPRTWLTSPVLHNVNNILNLSLWLEQAWLHACFIVRQCPNGSAQIIELNLRPNLGAYRLETCSNSLEPYDLRAGVFHGGRPNPRFRCGRFSWGKNWFMLCCSFKKDMDDMVPISFPISHFHSKIH